MVYSASVAMPDNPKFARYTPTYFLSRHVMFMAIAVAVRADRGPGAGLGVGENVALDLRRRVAAAGRRAACRFVGKGVNGARRWIPLGIMNFQPSELTKLAIAMYAAGYMVRKHGHEGELRPRASCRWRSRSRVVGLLLLPSPTWARSCVIAAIAMGILFLGGVNGRLFAG